MLTLGHANGDPKGHNQLFRLIPKADASLYEVKRKAPFQSTAVVTGEKECNGKNGDFSQSFKLCLNYGLYNTVTQVASALIIGRFLACAKGSNI